MKKQEYQFQLEIYDQNAVPIPGFFRAYKCFDIEGARQIKRYNVVLQPFKTTYWLSLRAWNSRADMEQGT